MSVPEPNSEIEEDLLARAIDGDRNAYGELAARCYPAVVRVVYRLCGDAQLAEDAAQEAFIRAWTKLPGYQSKAPFCRWVYRIAVNIALDVLRRKPHDSLDEDSYANQLAGSSPDPEAVYIEREQSDRVQKAIRALPEGARAVLVLREYGGLSYDEISSTLDIPAGTVMSRLNYARTRLREMLREDRAEMERVYA
ncbi:MAG: sigma-70 family RNA polymerase sigma factor [Leptolinea sp.]|nr:sigma-70 family RNA polymerase sigma factor [Leptolinea sp.]